MKINFITSEPNAPCSLFYSHAFSRCDKFSFYDKSIDNYDVNLLMTYDHKLTEIIRKNSKSLIGIIDPRKFDVLESTKYADFLVVDSFEMQDYWRCANKPIFRYAEYPEVSLSKKIHYEKNKIRIGYHGNKIHLECMVKNVTPALNILSKKYDLTLVLAYTGESPRGTEEWLPKNIAIEHHSIGSKTFVYEKVFEDVDIGIVPNLMTQERFDEEHKNKYKENHSQDDYVLRFKMPSNPGRMIVFARLGIPVIADLYPSSIQLLSEDRGCLAYSTDGWLYELEKLITSHDLRNLYSQNLRTYCERFDFDTQNRKFISFLDEL